MKKLLVLVCLSVLLFPVFGAGQEESESGSESIRIGAVYPLTGNVAPIGQNVKKGVDFAVAEINANGGVLGRQIEIVYGDSTGDPQTGMSEAERLITREEITILLGCYQSAVTNVVSEVAQRYEVPHLTAISTADQITTRGFEYFFRLPPTNMMYLRDEVQYVYDINERDNLGFETVGFLVDNSILGQETLKWGKRWAEEIGFEVVAEVQYSNDSVDLSSEILEVKQEAPDVLFVDPYISDAILLVRTMREQGFVPSIVISKGSGFIDPSFVPSLGDLANGASTAVEWNTDMPKGAEINERFRAEYDIDMNGHSAEAYTAINVLVEAIKAAGSAESDAVRDALENLEVDGEFSNGIPIILPYEKIDFQTFENPAGLHTNQNRYARITIAQVQDGVYRTIWPFVNAVVEPIIPMEDAWE